jgi:hypothetical protein
VDADGNPIYRISHEVLTAGQTYPFGMKLLAGREHTPDHDEEANHLEDEKHIWEPVQFCGVSKSLPPNGSYEFIKGVPTVIYPATDHWKLSNLFMFNSDVWVRGKHAPMYVAYARAAYSLSKLRWYLAASNRKRLTEYMSPCKDNDHMNPVTREEAAIRIPLAPDLHIAYSEKVPSVGWALTSEIPVQFLITGMCLAKDCVPEDLLPRNEYDFSQPSFTKGQKAAMKALDFVNTPEFWVQTAHSNGIYNKGELAQISGTAQAVQDAAYERYPDFKY